jgi:hypothetical protein
METEDLDTQELRLEIREAASEFAAVELKPSTSALSYVFKLRDLSSSGLGLLVKKDSGLLNYIRTQDIMVVKYHKGNSAIEPQYIKVQVRHISTPINGKPENHVVVGLLVLEKLGKEERDATRI